jgi:hypothetical protein
LAETGGCGQHLARREVGGCPQTQGSDIKIIVKAGGSPDAFAFPKDRAVVLPVEPGNRREQRLADRPPASRQWFGGVYRLHPGLLLHKMDPVLGTDLDDSSHVRAASLPELFSAAGKKHFKTSR